MTQVGKPIKQWELPAPVEVPHKKDAPIVTPTPTKEPVKV